MKGYFRKVLRVDLNTGGFSTLSIDESAAYNFVGGRGLGTWLLYNNMDLGVDPLGPENKIIFMAGPLTGTQVPGTGRIAVVSKSPLNGSIFESSLGGIFGSYMRWAGWDGILLDGRADKPVYLLVDNERVSLGDASPLWGKLTSETENALEEKYERSGIAEIGPAGEHLSSTANIMHATRTAGRGGMGAVLGSKNVKAIVTRGNKPIEFANKDAYERGLKRIQGIIMDDPVTGINGALATFGTNAIMHRVNDASTLPVSNFTSERMEFDEADQFSGETVKEKYFHAKSGCYRCPTVCGREIKVGGKVMKGPEYESIGMIGPNAGFYDYENEIVPLSIMCDELGMDTITVGSILAFAREVGHFDNCKNGEEQLAAAVKLLQDVAYGRSPFSKGVAHAARLMNREDAAMHVKGLEIPAYHPNGALGMALNYATSPKGADHTTGYTVAPELFGHPVKVDPKDRRGKAHLAIRMQNGYAIYDSAAMCIYHSIADFDDSEFSLDMLAKLLTAVTGFRYTSDILHEVGSRVLDLERFCNQKLGLTPDTDILPKRLGVDIGSMLKEYYEERGWPGGLAQGYRPLRPLEREKDFDLFLPALSRIEYPQIQVALDVPRASIEYIAKVAAAAYRGGARIIEAGTPALKMHGVENLLQVLKKAAPEALILADLKTYDMGKLEAEIAIDAGADIVSVLGKSGKEVIKEALSEARRRDKAVSIDLMGCSPEEVDRLTREFARELDHVIFNLHLGVTQQMKERGIYSKVELIRDFVSKTGKCRRAVAGGVKSGTLKDLVSQGMEIIVVGSAIYNASDPEAMTRAMLEEARQHYSVPH